MIVADANRRIGMADKLREYRLRHETNKDTRCKKESLHAGIMPELAVLLEVGRFGADYEFLRPSVSDRVGYRMTGEKNFNSAQRQNP